MLKVPNWKSTSKILNDLQLIVRSYKYLNICNPPLKMNGNPAFGVQKLYTTDWVVYKNPNIFMAITLEWASRISALLSLLLSTIQFGSPT